MSRRKHALIAATFGCAMLSLPGGAFAGVADSPLPQISLSGNAKTIFTIPGVIKNNSLETIFICTNLDKSAKTFAVEVFAAAGGPPLNNVGLSGTPPVLDGTETVQPGETKTIATGATVAIHEDKVISSLGPASVRNGSARIIATTKKLACSAFLITDTADPPSAMAKLSILSKTKQKGN